MSTTSRKEILELLAKGKITADEAANLLSQPAVEQTAVPDVETLKKAAEELSTAIFA